MRLTKSRIVSIILGVVVVASSVALLVRHRSNGGPPRAAGSPSATASSSSPTPFDTPTPTSSSSPGAGKTSGRPARDPRVQQPAFSRDGGVVAFTSIDPLTSNDTDRVADVFVRDRRTHTT